MSGSGCKSGDVAGEAKMILEALAVADKPYGSKDLVEATGLDKKVISKEVGKLKKKGLVENPVRCKYGITDDGRNSIA